MAATQGRKALVKVSGGAVSFTDEATTCLTNYTVFQITNAAKQAWDASASITVKKDTVAQSAALYTVNRLTGTITFLSDIGAGHTVTVSGSYLPLSTAAEAKEYSYSLTAQLLEDNSFGDTDVTRVQGLQDVSGTLSRWWSTDTYFSDALTAAVPVVIEFWADSSASFDRRVWALLDGNGIKAAISGLVDESVSFKGTPDADGRILSR